MFCISNEHQELGIGKVILNEVNSYKVGYFTSPTLPLKEISIDKKNIRFVKLEQNQRVFYNSNGLGQWMVGYVRDHMIDQQKIYIKFPNQEPDYYDINTEIYTRADIPIEDPTDFLANKLNETPLFTSNRNKFIKEYIKQRNACQGMSAYLSSNILLEEHQYNVVSKVLSDPFQRYLLADEVGLGKTVEAGILIKQHLIDQPTANVIIVTPNTLVNQWKEELIIRFNIHEDNGVIIIPYEEITKVKNKKYSMLVIDEAHNIVKNVNARNQTQEYKVIQKLSNNVNALLILSATPALGNEESFLAMLHILDPVLYPLNSLDQFKKKISNRQEIAQIVAQLCPENMYFLAEEINKLKENFNDDKLLLNLSDSLLKILATFPSEEDEDLIDAINYLKAHVSETYKLDRRILRNRRKKDNDLTYERTGCETIYYENKDVNYLIDSLEDWRLETLKYVEGDEKRLSEFSNIFLFFLNALFINPQKLIDYVELRINKISKSFTIDEEISFPKFELFENEGKFLNNIKSNAQIIISSKEKYKALVQNIKIITKNKKIIIFCSSNEICNELHKDLSLAFNNQVVSNSSKDYKKFLTSKDIKIFIANRDSEEGLNLQGTNANIIHYDIPLSPNRIEQRIGRIDRYGSRVGAKSFILINKLNTYENSWAECLNNGFMVFDSSIASLQFLVDEEIQIFKRKVLLEGYEIIEDFTSKLKEKIPKEIHKIKVNDALNELNILDRKENFYYLNEIDEEVDEIANNFSQIIDRSYKIRKSFDPNHDNIFKYKYLYNQYKGNSLISYSDFIKFFRPAISKFDGYSILSKSLSFDRLEKVKNDNFNILRYGSEFIECLYNYTLRDERGISFALWRYQPDYQPINNNVDLFFRFDFIVETNLDPITEYCKKINDDNFQVSFSNLKRLGDEALPAFFDTIWFDQNGELVNDEIIKTYLTKVYSKSSDKIGSYDKNLNSQRWNTIQALELNVLDFWKDLCFELSIKAKKQLFLSDEIKNINKRVNKLKKKDEENFIQKKARISHLHEEDAKIETERLKVDQQMRNYLYEGCLDPRITLDSIGAIFLSDKELIENEN